MIDLLIGVQTFTNEKISLWSTYFQTLVLFDRGDEVMVRTGDEGVRFLLVSGKPFEEPVAWRGPIVMNTREELQQAYAELREGSFVKDPSTW